MSVPLKNLNIQIDVARHEVLDSRWDSDLHMPWSRLVPFSRLYLPCEGDGVVRCKGRDYHLRPGRMLLIPAYAATHVSCSARLVKYWTHFNAHIGESKVDLFTFVPSFLECDVEPGKMELTTALFRRIVDSHAMKNNNASALDLVMARSALTLLLEPFLRQMPGWVGMQNNLPRFFEIVACMRSNMYRNMSMDEIGRAAGLHPNYLSRVFRSWIGMAPITYMRMLKLHDAVRLLHMSSMTIGEIAGSLGYDSISSFSKAFRKKLGVSPRAYRKANAQG